MRFSTEFYNFWGSLFIIMSGNTKSRTRFLASSWQLILLAAFLGIVVGFFQVKPLISLAGGLSDVFVNLLRLVSLPIIFLSIVATASRMESVQQVRELGRLVAKYTLMTTLIAASIALFLFLVIDPVRGVSAVSLVGDDVELVVGSSGPGYLSYLLKTIPSNIVQPFLENNVIGVLFLAVIFSLAILSLPSNQRETLHDLFAALYAVVMKITSYLIALMPVAVWAFVTLFMDEVKSGGDMSGIALYLATVVSANLIQGLVILPILVWSKGISPISLFRSMAPALSIAFFSKSSSAALPMAMNCAKERAGIPERVTSFSLPLCTTINMNGCAAFILTTVLFVSMSHGVSYTVTEMVMWIFIATIAAIGNAGVPMGCYFLSTALLASMNVPLNVLGVILPFYAMIDMLESAINVWSDSCVTALVDRDLKEKEGMVAVQPQQA